MQAKRPPFRYDVMVVGAGHAGCEAGRACARLGMKTAIVTMNLDLIAPDVLQSRGGRHCQGPPGAAKWMPSAA